MKVLLGVTGSIAAYKAASVTSALVANGHEVRVCMTRAAREFVGPLTFSALSRQPIILDEDEFKADGRILHIETAQDWADTLVVAPATYDFIGKLFACRADDALSSICAAWGSNVLLCPAMNEVMWKNLQEAMGANPYCVRTTTIVKDPDLIGGFPTTVRKFVMLRPAKGRLACGGEAEGRMRPTADIVHFIENWR